MKKISLDFLVSLLYGPRITECKQFAVYPSIVINSLQTKHYLFNLQNCFTDLRHFKQDIKLYEDVYCSQGRIIMNCLNASVLVCIVESLLIFINKTASLCNSCSFNDMHVLDCSVVNIEVISNVIVFLNKLIIDIITNI